MLSSRRRPNTINQCDVPADSCRWNYRIWDDFVLHGWLSRLIKDCGAQLLTFLVLVQSALLLDRLPSMAMSTIHPYYLSIAGTVVDKCQDVSTHQWACAPSLWGLLLLQDPKQFSLGPHHLWVSGYVPAGGNVRTRLLFLPSVRGTKRRHTACTAV